MKSTVVQVQRVGRAIRKAEADWLCKLEAVRAFLKKHDRYPSDENEKNRVWLREFRALRDFLKKHGRIELPTGAGKTLLVKSKTHCRRDQANILGEWCNTQQKAKLNPQT
jgi:hypothetical protein